MAVYIFGIEITHGKNYETNIAIDTFSKLHSFSMVEDGVNPRHYYKARSAIIGEDHEWSIEINKVIKNDCEIIKMMRIRALINKTNIHELTIDDEYFEREMLEALFQSKTYEQKIEFLKETEAF